MCLAQGPKGIQNTCRVFMHVLYSTWQSNTLIPNASLPGTDLLDRHVAAIVEKRQVWKLLSKDLPLT